MAEPELNDHSGAMPPPLAAGVPPPLSPPPLITGRADPKPSGWPLARVAELLLSLCLGLFLVDGLASVLDDGLVYISGSHAFSLLRGIISFFTGLMAIGIYGLMALTPKVPKRLFLPIPLFLLAAILAVFPFAIYCYGRLPLVALGASLGELVLGLLLLAGAQGGLTLRWPLVPAAQFGGRIFSWKNLAGFILATVFGLVPAVLIYLFLCTSLAVNHFTAGFMSLRPGGLTVHVKKYVRADGKVIELFPMAHVADARFYRQVEQTFPTNSIILLEGVSDDKNLLTNKLSYKRMAKSLGLSEQKAEFAPDRGKAVRADVDVSQFTQGTIDCLNLVSLAHAKGLNSQILQQLLANPMTPGFEETLFHDILTKRNEHLLGEIQSRLAQSDNIMVPWGAAHMPWISSEIQKSGFRPTESHEYSLIRFWGKGKEVKGK